MKNIIINTNEEVDSLSHDKLLSHTFDKIECDSIHFKNINFNIISPQLLLKLRFKTIKFERCILGNLHYLDFNQSKEVYFIDQELDSFLNTVVFPNVVIYDNIKFNNDFFFYFKGYYDTLYLKNLKNINEILCNLKKEFRVNNFHLENNIELNHKSYEVLSDKLDSERIKKIWINDKEIVNSKGLNSFLRKHKIKNLIQNA